MSDVPRMAEGHDGVKCQFCGLAVRWGIGCLGPEFVAPPPDLRRLQRAERPRGDLHDDLGHYCSDCGAGVGQYHHFGCDLERCARCGQQLFFGCGCLSIVKTDADQK